MKPLEVAHCDACGREIVNVKESFIVSERENYAIVECSSCGHHQSVSYRKKREGGGDVGKP